MPTNTPFLRVETPDTQSRLRSLVSVHVSYGGYQIDQNSDGGAPTSLPPWTLIGGLTKANIDITRGATPRRELNPDTMGSIIEQVPGLVDYKVNFEYVYLYKASFLEACGFAGTDLKFQTRPLMFMLTFPSPDPATIPVKTLLLTDCWLGNNPISMGVDNKDDLRIIQSIDINVAGVFEI